MKNVISVTRRALSLCLLASLALPVLAAESRDLSPPDALAAVQAGKLTLIDVRTPDEWKETGVAQGAARIDMNQPRGAAGFVDEVLKRTKGDKNAPVALICRSGNRSTQMQSLLQAQGFTKVFNVREGMSGGGAGPGWLRRGLPLQKD